MGIAFGFAFTTVWLERLTCLVNCGGRCSSLEAAANELTKPALDPIAKIAELKYCAVAVEAVR